MSALEASIESLTAEHAVLIEKLAQIDQQYRVERPVIVSQIGQLAKALSALTGKPVAGALGQPGRKAMSEEGKAAIRAGLEKARAAKTAATSQASVSAIAQPSIATAPPQAKPTPVAAPSNMLDPSKKATTIEKAR